MGQASEIIAALLFGEPLESTRLENFFKYFWIVYAHGMHLSLRILCKLLENISIISPFTFQHLKAFSFELGLSIRLQFPVMSVSFYCSKTTMAQSSSHTHFALQRQTFFLFYFEVVPTSTTVTHFMVIKHSIYIRFIGLFWEKDTFLYSALERMYMYLTHISINYPFIF